MTSVREEKTETSNLDDTLVYDENIKIPEMPLDIQQDIKSSITQRAIKEDFSEVINRENNCNSQYITNDSDLIEMQNSTLVNNVDINEKVKQLRERQHELHAKVRTINQSVEEYNQYKESYFLRKK